MRVKIIKASEDSFWYAKHIGQIFEVEPANLKYLEYVVVPRRADGAFYIVAEDCEVVEEE